MLALPFESSYAQENNAQVQRQATEVLKQQFAPALEEPVRAKPNYDYRDEDEEIELRQRGVEPK